MKRLLIVAAIFISLAEPACNSKSDKKSNNNISDSDVPAAVKSAFTAKYGEVSNVEWEHAKENNQATYKAKFKMGDEKWKAEFNPDGSLLKEKKDD
jgi:hypothetical protein